MELPLRIRHDAQTPIYSQIMYQLSYLITSSQLEEGRKLPTVREVAEALHVNAGTVARAYRELRKQGLVEAEMGSGTYVANKVDGTPDAAARQDLLFEAMSRAIHRGFSMGFTEGEVRHIFENAIGSQSRSIRVLFVAPSMSIGHKYALSIEDRLTPAVKVSAATFDELEVRDPHVTLTLTNTYFVITFARFVREVQGLLERFLLPHRVVGIGTVVQPQTVEELKQIEDTERLCLVTQEAVVDPGLSLIAEHCGRRPEDVDVCIDGNERAAREVLPRADRILYSYSAKPFLDRMGVPAIARVEISFDITTDSLEYLRSILKLGST